jgi:hypothetical protein
MQQQLPGVTAATIPGVTVATITRSYCSNNYQELLRQQLPGLATATITRS